MNQFICSEMPALRSGCAVESVRASTGVRPCFTRRSSRLHPQKKKKKTQETGALRRWSETLAPLRLNRWTSDPSGCISSYGTRQAGQPGGRTGVPGVLWVPVGRREDPVLRTCVLPRLSGENAGLHQQRWDYQRHYCVSHLPTSDLHQKTKGFAGVFRRGQERSADAWGACSPSPASPPGHTARLSGPAAPQRQVAFSVF